MGWGHQAHRKQNLKAKGSSSWLRAPAQHAGRVQMESWWTGFVLSARGQTGVWELDRVGSSRGAWSGRRVLPTIPTLVELCSADQAFPLITNRRALSHPLWPFHSLPWVVSSHNLQRAGGPLPKRRASALKAGAPARSFLLLPPCL